MNFHAIRCTLEILYFLLLKSESIENTENFAFILFQIKHFLENLFSYQKHNFV